MNECRVIARSFRLQAERNRLSVTGAHWPLPVMQIFVRQNLPIATIRLPQRQNAHAGFYARRLQAANAAARVGNCYTHRRAPRRPSPSKMGAGVRLHRQALGIGRTSVYRVLEAGH